MVTNIENPLLICYDGSKDSKHAIKRAGELFKAKQALILTVWNPTANMGNFAWTGMMAPMVDFVALDKNASDNAAKIANEGTLIAQNAGLEAYPLPIKTNGPTRSEE